MRRHSDLITATGVYLNLSCRLSPCSTWKLRVMIFNSRDFPHHVEKLADVLKFNNTSASYPVGFTSVVRPVESGNGGALEYHLPWPNWMDPRSVTQNRRDDIMKGRPQSENTRLDLVYDHVYVLPNRSKSPRVMHVNVSKNIRRLYKFPSKYRPAFLRGMNVPYSGMRVDGDKIEEIMSTPRFVNEEPPFRKLYVVLMAHATVPGEEPLDPPTDHDLKFLSLPRKSGRVHGDFPAGRIGDSEEYLGTFDGVLDAPLPPAGESASQKGDRDDDGDAPPAPPPRKEEKMDEDDEEPYEENAIDPSFVGPKWAYMEVSTQIDFCFRDSADAVPRLS
jgi:hypothetical protein